MQLYGQDGKTKRRLLKNGREALSITSDELEPVIKTKQGKILNNNQVKEQMR